MAYPLLFVASALMTLALTPVFRTFFHRMGWVDHPDQHRKLHQVPIPRLGGLPICVAFFCSVGLMYWLPGSLAASFQRRSAGLIYILLPSLLVLAIGVWDDIRGASPFAKIVVQAIAGYWLWTLGVGIHHIGVPGTSGVNL